VTLTPVAPIDVSGLFEEERGDLLALLAALTTDEWARPTVCASWDVQDLAAHVLGDDLGTVAHGRDGHRGGFIDAASYPELVAAIDAQNAAWVQSMRRLSPRLLVELLAFSGERVFAHFGALDPMATGGPVDWAGPEPAPVWLDVAREYTERWAHGQQIRDALGRPGLFSRRMFAPVLDTYSRALPHTFREVVRAEGTAVTLAITGDAGGAWTLMRERGAWRLYAGSAEDPAASVTIGQDDAWRVFTKGLSPEEAARRGQIDGDGELGRGVLRTVSILA
jgi:uncharacterized protein (TIGR03083 family)